MLLTRLFYFVSLIAILFFYSQRREGLLVLRKSMLYSKVDQAVSYEFSIKLLHGPRFKDCLFDKFIPTLPQNYIKLYYTVEFNIYYPECYPIDWKNVKN